MTEFVTDDSSKLPFLVDFEQKAIDNARDTRAHSKSVKSKTSDSSDSDEEWVALLLIAVPRPWRIVQIHSNISGSITSMVSEDRGDVSKKTSYVSRSWTRSY